MTQQSRPKFVAHSPLAPVTAYPIRMSALGPTRKSALVTAMSAFPPLATKPRTSREVRLVPVADQCAPASSPLFNHLICAQQQRGRNFDTNGLRGSHVHHSEEFRRLLNGKIGRLRAAENLIHENCCTSPHIGEVDSITHKASGLREPDESAASEFERCRKLRDGLDIIELRWVFQSHESADRLGGHRCEDAFQIGRLTYRKLREFEPERLSRQSNGR